MGRSSISFSLSILLVWGAEAWALDVSDCPAGYNIIIGTSGDDVLTGTSGNDCILGGDGNDTISGGGGNDFLIGGNGNDTIQGDNGDDVIYGEAGNDILHGGNNDDVISGGDGNDQLYGDNGEDSLYGGDGDDELYGGNSGDLLNGGAGNDTLDGGNGSDGCQNGSGADTSCESTTYASIQNMGLSDTGQWQFTATVEAGTLGYRVEAWSETRSAFEPVDSFLTHESRRYAIHLPFDAKWVRVIEIDHQGRDIERYLGPTRQPSAPHNAACIHSTTTIANRFLRQGLTTAPSVGAMRIWVGTRGIYRIAYEQLAEMWGLSSEHIQAQVESGDWRLERQGISIAWNHDAVGLWFFHPGATDDVPIAYRLVSAAGDRMTTVPVRDHRASTPVGFRRYLSTEANVFSPSDILSPEDAAVWFERALAAWHPDLATYTWSVEMSAPPTEASTLVVLLKGASLEPHPVEISINDQLLGSIYLQGRNATKHVLRVPSALWQSGTNHITLRALVTETAPLNVIYLDRLELSVPATELMLDGSATVDLDPSTVLELPATDAYWAVLDITDPDHPTQYEGWQQKTLGVPTPTRVFLARSEDIRTPTLETVAVPSEWSPPPQVDWLMVAPTALMTVAEAWRAHRERGGLSTALIDVESIYRHYSHQVPSADAIRAFFSELHAVGASPRFVVFLGRDRHDLTPASRVHIGHFPSAVNPDLETRVVDDDSLVVSPSTRVGRIPAQSEEEAWTLLEKVERFERTLRTGVHQTIVDVPDATTSFASQIDGSRPADALIALEDFALSDQWAAIERAWTPASDVVSYLGHGSWAQWSTHDVLNPTNVPDLPANNHPIVVAPTCLMNQHNADTERTLSEALLFEETGAVAVWAPATFTNEVIGASVVALADPFLQQQPAFLGTWIDAIDTSLDLRASWELLGDPALTFQWTSKTYPAQPNAEALSRPIGCQTSTISAPWLLVFFSMFRRRRRTSI